MTREQRTKGFTVAMRCQDAYSAMAYRSWPAVGAVLIARGYNEHEAEVIMRSKVTRWARDAWNKPARYGEYPAAAVEAFLNDPRNAAMIAHDFPRWFADA